MRERDNVLLVYPNVHGRARATARRTGAGHARSREGGRLPEGLGRERSRGARPGATTTSACSSASRSRCRRRPTARRPSTDEVARRRRLEHVGRAHPVGADDPRRRGSQLHVPAGVRRRGREVREARRRDDARPRRRAGRALGRRPRHARLRLRLQAAGGRHLPRQHDDRRADADAQEPAHRASTCSASRPTASTSCTGRTTSSRRTTSTPARRRALGGTTRARASSTWSSIIRARSRRTASPATRSDGKAVIVQHRYDLWVAAARRIGGAQPDERRRGEERDSLPLRADRAGRRRRRAIRLARRSARGGRGGGSAPDDRSVEADHAVGVRRVDEEGRLLRAGRTASSKRSCTRTRRSARRRGRRRPTRTSSRGRRSSSSRTCACRVRTSRSRRRSPTPIRSRPSTCGAVASCSTSRTRTAVRLQGILALPDDYKPGEKRPMLVTFYEKNSQNLHRYNAPSYLTGMGSSPIQAVSEGYITMLPDIHFHTGSSHSDMLDCVEAAMRKVIEMGYVDPKRIGINGHSYGGEGAAFIGTRSRAVRRGRHGRRRHRSLLRLQPELGLVVSGDRRQRRERQRLLPVRPGPLGLLAVGQARDLPVRVRADARARSDGAVPDHARHRGSDGVVHRTA